MKALQAPPIWRRSLWTALVLGVSVWVSATPTLAASKKAGPGEVCEEDKDEPRPPRRILVLDLVTEGDAEPALAKAFAEDIRSTIVDRDDLVLFSQEAAVATGVEGLDSCQKSTCMADIAAATESTFVLYGTLRRVTIDGQVGWNAEVRVYDATEGRPLGKFDAQSTEPAQIGAALRDEGPKLVPLLPELKVVDCGPPALVERPLFILGTATTLLGAVAFLGAAAWAVDLEQKLASPVAHRDLKWEAVLFGRYALAATAASTLVVATGVGLLAAGVLIVEEE